MNNSSKTSSLHPILAEYRREKPGSYLSDSEISKILSDQPEMDVRLRAAKKAEMEQQSILDYVIPTVLAKYDFRGRFEYGESKCYRDVAAVYRYCVFAMLCGDLDVLKNKLLYWMRTVIQALDFPSGKESIKFTYTLLRNRVRQQLPPEFVAVLDPYFQAVEEVLPEVIRWLKFRFSRTTISLMIFVTERRLIAAALKCASCRAS